MRARSVAAALLFVAVSGTASAQSREDARRREVGHGLTLAGVTVLAATWLVTGAATTTLVTLANARDATIAEAWVPVVGPWVMLGDTRGFDTSQVVLTAVSAVVQLAALAVLLVGVVLELVEGRSAPVAP